MIEGRDRPISPDYDTDPERFRTARAVLRRFARADDVHPRIARRMRDEARAPVLDVGCGEGELARHLPEGWWVGMDTSPTMLAAAPSPAFVADANRVPFPDDYFGAVAMLYVLHHVAAPEQALAEAHRVLEPGGLLALAATSRHDSPELAAWLPQEAPTFDAELAPEIVGRHFDQVEVEAWDMPLLELPDAAAVRDYLVGKGTALQRARTGAAEAEPPVVVTKRGAIVWARGY